MTATKSAAAETLTAEVRVLMVGSRQVTMSVYSQLDYIDPEEIEPFGRVNPRDAEWWRTYVIGRNKKTGSLVRSSTLSEKGISRLKKGRSIWKGQYQVIIHEWDTESGREQGAVLSAEWSALPLIVLGGLR